MSLPYDPAEIAALAAQYDLPVEELTRRLFGQYWDEFLAFVLPCVAADEVVDLIYIGIDGKARYKVTWTDKPVTARDIIERFVPHHLPMYDLIYTDEQYAPYPIP